MHSTTCGVVDGLGLGGIALLGHCLMPEWPSPECPSFATSPT